MTIRIKDSDGTIIPLQRNFVEHVAWEVPVGLYITDDAGRVRHEDGSLGIETSDAEIDIRVLLQNSVVKHQDMFSWKDWKVSDGDTKTLRTSNTEHIDKFRVLNHCVKVYDKVFRQFEVFSTSSRGDFPLGSSGSLSAKKDRLKRIGLDFPSGFPFAPLSFTEPKAMFSDYPILHIRDDDDRLFGTIDDDGQRHKRTLIASELAHGLHFSDLTIFQREGLQDHYLGWLIGQVTSGGDPTHGLEVITTPLIAFIEALDHFPSRFFAFVLDNPNDGIDSNFRNRFIESELLSINADRSKIFCDFNGDLHTGTVSNPKFMGESTEGAIYAALFLDFARRPGVGLKTVVNAFFRSRALTIEDFSRWW